MVIAQSYDPATSSVTILILGISGQNIFRITQMTETVENSVEGFNLADWLTGGTEHRARKKVDLYLDANLGAEIDEIEQEMKLAEATDMDSLGENTVSHLEQRKEALLKRIGERRATVEVYALIDSELAEARARAGEDASGDAVMYEILADAATMNGEKLTGAQWAQVHATVGAQFNAVPVAYRAAERVPVDARFRR